MCGCYVTNRRCERKTNLLKRKRKGREKMRLGEAENNNSGCAALFGGELGGASAAHNVKPITKLYDTLCHILQFVTLCYQQGSVNIRTLSRM